MNITPHEKFNSTHLNKCSFNISIVYYDSVNDQLLFNWFIAIYIRD